MATAKTKTTKRTSGTTRKPAKSAKAVAKKVAAATAKPSVSKAVAKKAPVKKRATKKASASKTPAKKAATKKAASKKAPAKKTSARKKSALAASSATSRTTLSPSSAKATRGAGAKRRPTKGSEADRASAKPKKAAGSVGKTTKPKSPFGEKFVAQQREILLAEREKYTRSAKNLRDEAQEIMDGREPGDVQFDEESGEGDSLAVERDRDLALSAQALDAVDQINAALARVDAGTYGVCVVSGKNVPKERLEAIPWAAERVEYKIGGFS